MTPLFALLAALSFQPADEGPIRTGGSVVAAESADEIRMREAIAYANPMPRGAPETDYALVAWCDALVSGHVTLGRTLTNPDDLDRDIIRLGQEEVDSFRDALRIAGPRQSAQARAEAETIAAARLATWDVFMDQDELTRSNAFGLFMGLPGRCEHAARRLRNNITTPPATPADVGLETPTEPAV
jgi:hypothetical protein